MEIIEVLNYVILALGLAAVCVFGLVMLFRRGKISASLGAAAVKFDTRTAQDCIQKENILVIGDRELGNSSPGDTVLRDYLISFYAKSRKESRDAIIVIDGGPNSTDMGGIMEAYRHMTYHNGALVRFKVKRRPGDLWWPLFGRQNDTEIPIVKVAVDALEKRNRDNLGTPGYNPATTTGELGIRVFIDQHWEYIQRQEAVIAPG